MPSLQAVGQLLGFSPLLIIPVFFMLVITYLWLKPKIEDRIEEVVGFLAPLYSYLILYLQVGEKFDFGKGFVHALVLGGLSAISLLVVGPIMRPIIKASQQFLIDRFEKGTGIDVPEGEENGAD